MRDEMVEPEAEGAEPLAVSASFGTISEYFFLTIRMLHMGLLSSFSMMENLMKQHSRLQQVGPSPLPPPPTPNSALYAEPVCLMERHSRLQQSTRQQAHAAATPPPPLVVAPPRCRSCSCAKRSSYGSGRPTARA